MAEENSFKESLNWKKISIDAVNTIIATAIGIIIGLLVDKWRENISNQENYQKVITLLSEGKGPQEIAEILGCSHNAATIKCCRARKALREKLDEQA